MKSQGKVCFLWLFLDFSWLKAIFFNFTWLSFLQRVTSDNPNSIKIQIQIAHLTSSSQFNQRAHNNTSKPTLAGQPKALGVSAYSTNATKLTIWIPAPSTVCKANLYNKNEPDADEEITAGWHTFCPLEHCDAIIGMMEWHFCAHPLIPGYFTLTPEEIKVWAVKQSYEFCILHDLLNLWAYLLENWYWRGRWELWACSADPREIPCLKTTMFVEGQWVNQSE